jgi:cobalamin synthase
MSNELETKAIAGKMAIAILAIIGIYYAAFWIAVIATFARMAYKSEKSTSISNWFEQWFRLFIINISLAMLIVHVGAWAKYTPDLIIVISAIVAFLSREILDTILYVMQMLKTKWLAQIVESKIGGKEGDK